ncbi:hypothetical protein DUI87_05119 [Hirundo rustica rustica]|uniref:Integrase-type domain-containing protein n=1 Tax=Hirundo rustica rustica TaxID=333673 RepID=A0A3M0KYB1_HIRRU|nr:hypothetical protein DUI87_05119 [Hirundo rustica rustica]
MPERASPQPTRGFFPGRTGLEAGTSHYPIKDKSQFPHPGRGQGGELGTRKQEEIPAFLPPLSHTNGQKGGGGAVHRFELQEEKIQRMPPWKYLGVEIGQAIVERTHQNLKRVLSQQHQSLKLETPQIQLSKALFTLNFLNCKFENLSPPIVRHFRENCHHQLKAKPLVMVKDPATRETEGPHDLITWGHEYTCVSTPSGPKWVPAKPIPLDKKPWDMQGLTLSGIGGDGKGAETSSGPNKAIIPYPGQRAGSFLLP